MLAHDYDSWPSLVENMARPDMLHRLVLGRDDKGELLITEPRRNVLILGPPRSQKTAGVLTPAILAHPGPVVTARPETTCFGRLVSCGLGWVVSGITARTARRCHRDAVSCAGLRSRRRRAGDRRSGWASRWPMSPRSAADGKDASFFREKAGVLIPPLLHAAALGDKPMLLAAEGGSERPADGRRGEGDPRRRRSGRRWELALNSLEGILGSRPEESGDRSSQLQRNRLRGLHPPWSHSHDRGAELRSR